MAYTLTFTFDQTGVNQINAAGQFVTIAQSVQAYVQSASSTLYKNRPMAAAFATLPSLAVVWAAFSPYLNNTVSWTSNYALYASTTAVQNGNVIQQLAQQPSAQIGYVYPFSNNAFGAPSSFTTTGYLATNNQGMQMTFGLATAATVNSVVQSISVLNASAVLNNQTAWFTPSTTVSILLSSVGTVNSVIQPLNMGLTVSLSPTNNTATIGFNDSTNSFYLVS